MLTLPLSGNMSTSGERLNNACAACRLRRIKCVREDPMDFDTPCLKCQQKGIQCTTLVFQSNKGRKLNRAGKRINTAKAIYGESTAVTESKPTDSSSSSSADSPAHDQHDVTLLPIIPTTERLNVNEIQGALSSNLLDFYLNFTKSHPSLLEATDFRAAWARSQQRTSELDDASQVLCAVLLALSARTSDHPMLVGPDAPRMDNLSLIALEGTDLSPYGYKREEACRALTARAVQLADEKGVWRNPSVESIAALTLLEGLVEGSSKTRVYANTYNGHARHLLRQSFFIKTQLQRTSQLILWIAYMRETLRSGKEGQSTAFSDDDLYLLYNGQPPPQPLVVTLLGQPLPDAQDELWRIFLAFLIHLSRAGQDAGRNLTGIIAQSRPHLDESFIAVHIPQLELSFVALPIITSLAQSFFTAHPFFSVPSLPHVVSKDFFSFVRALSVSVCSSCFSLDKVVQGRLRECEERMRDDEKWRVEAEMKYRERLVGLMKTTGLLAFGAARYLAGLLRESLRTCNFQNEWLDERGTGMLFLRLPFWFSLIAREPTVEEGGQVPEFTFAVKLDEMKWVLKGAAAHGWASKDLADHLPRLQATVTSVEEQQAAYWTSVVSVVDDPSGCATSAFSDELARTMVQNAVDALTL